MTGAGLPQALARTLLSLPEHPSTEPRINLRVPYAKQYYGGMKAGLPEEVRGPNESQTPKQLARTLVEMARHVDPKKLLKHPRGPKPRKKKGQAPGSEVRRQVATSRVLAAGTVDYVKQDV